MEIVTDFTLLPVGHVINSWKGGKQVATECPRCHRIAKPSLHPQGQLYTHKSFGFVTEHCLVCQQPAQA